MSEDNGIPTLFYRIRHWEDEYENSQSRPLKYLRWVPMPILTGTPQYAELLDHPEGPAHFGLWNAIIQLAAQCQPRGSLLKEGGVPHTQTSIALYCRFPSDVCGKALERYRMLGWLDALPYSPTTKHTTYEPTEDQRIPSARQRLSEEKIQNTPNNARARTGQDRIENNTPPIPPLPRGEPASSDTAHTGRRRPRGMTKAEELTQHMFQRHKDGTL